MTNKCDPPMSSSDVIARARTMCIEWHGDQRRKYTDAPYYIHPFEVARILASIRASEEVQIAGLLHDVIEDCGVTKEEIAAQFGTRVADLVDMVTDVSKPEDGNRATRKALDRDHVAKADADGQTIKLADLISNARSIVEHDPKFAKVYMAEKRDLLAVLVRGDATLYQRAQEIVHAYERG